MYRESSIHLKPIKQCRKTSNKLRSGISNDITFTVFPGKIHGIPELHSTNLNDEAGYSENELFLAEYS